MEGKALLVCGAGCRRDCNVMCCVLCCAARSAPRLPSINLASATIHHGLASPVICIPISVSATERREAVRGKRSSSLTSTCAPSATALALGLCKLHAARITYSD